MATVSVHIVTYNSAAYIKQCLEAVMKQSYPIHEVIIVDNKSQDHTIDIIQKLASDIKFTIVQNESNTGFAAGHNMAMNMSSCDYYLVLNPDVNLDPDYVFHLVQHMEQHPDIGSATGKLIRMDDPSIIDSTGLIMYKSRKAVDRGSGESAARWDEDSEVFGVSGAAAMYRSRMVKEISLDGQFFDELFFSYKEDVDVAWRARLFGWKSYYLHQAIAYHARGWKAGERRKRSLSIRRHSYINRYYTILKNDSLRAIVLHLPFIIVFELASFILLIKEPGLIGAWKQFFKNYRKIIKIRRAIQKHRRASEKEIYNYFLSKVM